jgi:hypothetical protein
MAIGNCGNAKGDDAAGDDGGNDYYAKIDDDRESSFTGERRFHQILD